MGATCSRAGGSPAHAPVGPHQRQPDAKLSADQQPRPANHAATGQPGARRKGDPASDGRRPSPSSSTRRAGHTSGREALSFAEEGGSTRFNSPPQSHSGSAWSSYPHPEQIRAVTVFNLTQPPTANAPPAPSNAEPRPPEPVPPLPQLQSAITMKLKAPLPAVLPGRKSALHSEADDDENDEAQLDGLESKHEVVASTAAGSARKYEAPAVSASALDVPPRPASSLDLPPPSSSPALGTPRKSVSVLATGQVVVIAETSESSGSPRSQLPQNRSVGGKQKTSPSLRICTYGSSSQMEEDQAARIASAAAGPAIVAAGASVAAAPVASPAVIPPPSDVSHPVLTPSMHPSAATDSPLSPDSASGHLKATKNRLVLTRSTPVTPIFHQKTPVVKASVALPALDDIVPTEEYAPRVPEQPPNAIIPPVDQPASPDASHPIPASPTSPSLDSSPTTHATHALSIGPSPATPAFEKPVYPSPASGFETEQERSPSYGEVAGENVGVAEQSPYREQKVVRTPQHVIQQQQQQQQPVQPNRAKKHHQRVPSSSSLTPSTTFASPYSSFVHSLFPSLPSSFFPISRSLLWTFAEAHASARELEQRMEEMLSHPPVTLALALLPPAGRVHPRVSPSVVVSWTPFASPLIPPYQKKRMLGHTAQRGINRVLMQLLQEGRIDELLCHSAMDSNGITIHAISPRRTLEEPVRSRPPAGPQGTPCLSPVLPRDADGEDSPSSLLDADPLALDGSSFLAPPSENLSHLQYRLGLLAAKAHWRDDRKKLRSLLDETESLRSLRASLQPPCIFSPDDVAVDREIPNGGGSDGENREPQQRETYHEEGSCWRFVRDGNHTDAGSVYKECYVPFVAVHSRPSSVLEMTFSNATSARTIGTAATTTRTTSSISPATVNSSMFESPAAESFQRPPSPLSPLQSASNTIAVALTQQQHAIQHPLFLPSDPLMMPGFSTIPSGGGGLSKPMHPLFGDVAPAHPLAAAAHTVASAPHPFGAFSAYSAHPLAGVASSNHPLFTASSPALNGDAHPLSFGGGHPLNHEHPLQAGIAHPLHMTNHHPLHGAIADPLATAASFHPYYPPPLQQPNLHWSAPPPAAAHPVTGLPLDSTVPSQ